MSYFEEIEAHFASRRGTPFVVSAKDWALMKKWNEDGIPLPVVLEAMDSVFDKADANGRKVNGLSFFRHAVKELWDERKELRVGDENVAPEAGADDLLDALASRLPPVAASFAPRIRELAALRSVPAIEEKLIDLEHELIGALATDELRVLASQIDVAGLDEKTRARTIEANLRRVVREKFELPRLTLF